MKRHLAGLGALLALAGCAQPAADSNAPANGVAAAPQASVPDLKGTWVGTSESIVSGKAEHHDPASGKDPLLDNVQFTFTITGQEGHRFWGTVSSARGEEKIAGVIGLDGKTVVARDNDGEIEGTLVDPDTIQLIYTHGGASTVVAVNTIKRQK